MQPLEPMGAITAADVNSLAALVLEEVNRSTARNIAAFAERLQALERAKRPLQALVDRLAAESEELARELRAIYDDLFVSTDFGTQQAVDLQMEMDRMSKMMETLSNVMKKMDDTSGSIVQNLK